MAAAAPYHETQSLQRCLVHTVNALVQTPRFTPAEFDEFCEELNKVGENRFFNPHRSILHLGNYDANVLEWVCSKHLNCDTYWVRTQEKLAAGLHDPDLKGVVVNVPSGGLLGFCGCQHWFCVRPVGGVWFNLDSKLKNPRQLGDAEAAQRFLTPLLTQHRNHVIIVAENREPSGLHSARGGPSPGAPTESAGARDGAADSQPPG
eukprot:TRINITY_DN47262_c0_g1_i1.p1 TRINITY_DN47262_c0_g1~~TRINITY_DN47262_c0_g1_i1.p1  ORF type:complete len:232 (+),score=58.92 TRINITY_DN47262_c0_g1_i1:84-698(+)